MFRHAKPFGMAIKITPENGPLIAVVNNGVAPEFEADLKRGSYFVFPYNHEDTMRIVPGYYFEENWVAFDPQQFPVNTEYFVEIVTV